MDGTDYLKFSGLPQTAYVYNGYNNCSVKLPADKILKRLEIHITETTEALVASALFMLDDVKFIDSSFVTLDSDNDKDKDEDKDNESKADENPAQNEDNTDTGRCHADWNDGGSNFGIRRGFDHYERKDQR